MLGTVRYEKEFSIKIPPVLNVFKLSPNHFFFGYETNRLERRNLLRGLIFLILNSFFKRDFWLLEGIIK